MMYHPELPAGAFIAAVLVLVPLPHHWRARNLSTISLIIWLCVVNLIYGIDVIIWADSVKIVAVIWCDITIRVIVGANLAIPACCLSLAINLERVSSGREVVVNRSTKRRRMLLDVILCWGSPIFVMILYYTVQSYRFQIFQFVGCRPTYAPIVPAVILLFVPPLFLSTLTFVYAGVTLLHINRRWSLFGKYLADHNAGLATGDFLRLVVMVVIQMIGGIALTSMILFLNVREGLYQTHGWTVTHSNISHIFLTPAFFWGDNYKWIMVSWWIGPMAAFIVFACLSFTESVSKEYKASFTWFLGVVLRRPPDEPQNPHRTLPKMRREGALLSDNSYIPHPNFPDFTEHSTGLP